MKVFVDKDSCIRAVGTTTDTSLTELTINDETNPFEGWSKAKICCYRVTVVDGVVTMMTPYVDSKLLDTIDMIGHQIESITPYTETKTAYYGEKEKTGCTNRRNCLADQRNGDAQTLFALPCAGYFSDRF